MPRLASTRFLPGFLILVLSFACSAAEPRVGNQRATRTDFVNNPVFQGETYLEQWGDDSNPAIILVHGLGNNGAGEWRYLTPLLSKRFHVITFDLPGFGRSGKFNELYSPDNYARFIDWVAATYARKPFILVGHSMGGAIALAYATTHPHNIRQLILIDVAGILHHAAYSKSFIDNYKPNWWSHLLPNTEQLNRLLGFGIEDYDRFPEAIDLILSTSLGRKVLLGSDPARIAGLAMVEKDFSGLLERLTMPTLIVWGDKDNIAPLRTGKMLEFLLPDARLVTIAESGHVPMLEASEQLNKIIWAAVTDPHAPAARPKSPVFDDAQARNERCDKQAERYYSGRYNHLVINDCPYVTIENAKINYLEATNSSVAIYNSEVGDGAKALVALGSTVFATATRFTADVPLYVDDSRLDFAGVVIKANKQVFESKLQSYATFSLCTVESPQFSGYQHGVYQIPTGEASLW